MANWDYSKYNDIELVQDRNGRLTFKEADSNSNPDLVFGEGQDELAALWQTIVSAKQEAHYDFIVMYQPKPDDRGRLVAEKAAKVKESGWGLAYEPFQLDRCKPFTFEMHVRYGKPQLWVLTAPRPAKPGKAKAPPPARLELKRATAPVVEAVTPATGARRRVPRQA